MVAVKDIHTAGFKLFSELIPKKCMISIPTSSNQYKGKSFIFERIISSRPESERWKNLDSTFQEEYVEIKVFYDTIRETKDRTNTVTAPLSGYKNMNSKVSFKGTIYIIEAEEEGEFQDSLILLCKAVG